MLRICSLFGLAAALVLLAACQPDAVPAPDAPAGVAAVNQRAADGDTLVIAGERLRLAAIDAPELHQTCMDSAGETWACGLWAKERLAALLVGPATCEGAARDRYGRRLVHCHVGGQDLGAAMVAEGAARAYLRYGREYAGAETTAREAGRGIWQGSFADPEAVRRWGRRP
jgi:endonuclease YncB( thermonuclease family)